VCFGVYWFGFSTSPLPPSTVLRSCDERFDPRSKSDVVGVSLYHIRLWLLWSLTPRYWAEADCPHSFSRTLLRYYVYVNALLRMKQSLRSPQLDMTMNGIDVRSPSFLLLSQCTTHLRHVCCLFFYFFRLSVILSQCIFCAYFDWFDTIDDKDVFVVFCVLFSPGLLVSSSLSRWFKLPVPALSAILLL